MNQVNNPTNFGPLKLLIVQATPFCNINCDYCYLPDRSSRTKLSLDLIEPIFQKIFSSGLVRQDFTVVWHAGEPLSVPTSFYKSAIETIEKVRFTLQINDYKVLYNIQTNGTLINQKWCDFIKQYNINLGISLDGPAFIHNAHRKTRNGKGTHSSTMRGISFLHKNKIEFSVITVLTEDSLDYPDEMFKFYINNGIKRVGFNIEEKEGINQSSSLESKQVKNKNHERYLAFMNRFYELVKNSNNQLRCREFDYINNAIKLGTDMIKGQSTPFTMINIDSNGNFSTFSPELLGMKSDIYGDFTLGNILSDNFDEVYNAEKFKRLNQDIQAGVDLCRDTCEYFALCGGGAPSNKYYENGSFISSETMQCRYIKKALVDIVLKDIELSLGLEKNPC